MKKTGYILLLVATMVTGYLPAQILRNNGKMNVSGGYLVISGSYQNESSATITLDGTITVTGNWTNNSTTNVITSPGTNGEVIFNGTTQTIGGTADECDFEKLTINSGSTTQVTAGKGVTAYGTCTFTSPLILKSTTGVYKPQMATFINKSTVSGDINMELSYKSTGSSTAGASRAFYLSSPISNATSTMFKVSKNVLFYQNETTRKYVSIKTDGVALTVAKGYIFRSATDSLYTFSGTPNTASSYSNSSIPRVDANHYYLLGNPYPAVIDWDQIDKSNNISSTIWYRSCNSSGIMVTADTWNSDTQVGTSNNGTQVDGKIPPMQSVWIQCASNGTGSITIPSTVRTHSWGNASFLKSKGKQSQSKKDVFRLYLYSDTLRDETIIVQSESAQNTFENWDSRKLFAGVASIAELYTLSPEKYDLAIQSVKPIVKDTIIRIGINVGTEGDYKFIANLSGTLNESNIFLEDKQLDTTQDLLQKPEYLFHSAIVSDTSRFLIHYLPAPTVVVNSPEATCTPSTVDLTSENITAGSDAGLTYTYWTDAAATIPYTTPAYAEAGTYYIKGVASNGTYKIVGPIIVTINPTPSVITTNPAPVTAPATVDLTAPEITLGSTLGLLYTYWTDANATLPYNTPQTAEAGNYYIKGTVDSTGCYNIAGPVTVVINPSTGINPDVTDELTIYSFDKQIHILNCKPNSQIAIYDILGCQHYIGRASSSEEVISCNYKTGIYIVKVTSSNIVKSKKVYIR